MFILDVIGVYVYFIDFVMVVKMDDQGEVQGNGLVIGIYSFMGLFVYYDKVYCFFLELELLLYVFIDVFMDGYLFWYLRKVGWNCKLVVVKKYYVMYNIDCFEVEVLSMIYFFMLKLVVFKLRNIFFELKYIIDVLVDLFFQVLRVE